MTSTIVTTLIGIGATAVIALIGWTLKKVADNLSKDITNLSTSLNTKIDNLKSDLNKRVDDLKSDLNTRMDDLKSDLNTRMDKIEVRMGIIEVGLGNLKTDHAKLEGMLITLSQDRSQQPNQATQTSASQATPAPALPTSAG